MVVQKKKKIDTGADDSVSAGETAAAASPTPPATPAKTAEHVDNALHYEDVRLDFDWEYTADDLYLNLEEAVKEIGKKTNKAPTAAANLPPKIHRQVRSRSLQRKELSPKVKFIIGGVAVAILLAIYPINRYNRARKAEKLVEELDRIKKYKEWEEKEKIRLEKERYEKPAREYVNKTQDYITAADKLNVEKYANQSYQKAKGFLALAQESLKKEQWQRAYENANEAILAIDKAKTDTEAARQAETENNEKEKIVKTREALKTKFGALTEKFKAQANKANASIAEMETANAKSYYPIIYEESRALYQKGVDISNKELQEWASVKDKDLDEVLQKRVEVIQEALTCMEQAEAKSKEAATLTKNKKIKDQAEKMKKSLERKEQEEERMRKLKEGSLKVKSKSKEE